jgi:hypothetical protein
VVGFIGIVVPHLLRLVIGPAHRLLLPASALLGAILVVGADMLARTIVAPAEMPIGILAAASGAPFFPGHSASPAWIGRTMTAILKTRSVTVQISGATLVDGIDLQVNRGEMVAMQAGPQRHSGDRNPARP